MIVTDWFAGIGGVRLGLERAGYQCAWSCEIDPFARAVYGTRFGGEPGGADVTLVRASDVPPADLWVGGCPCQDLSTAGRRDGLAEGTRSGLLWTWLGLAARARPEWLLYENVPGLLSSKGGTDFASVLGTVDAMGYDASWRVLDARFFGVPQRRRRVFLLCRLRGSSARPWEVMDVPVLGARGSKPGTAWKNAGGRSCGVAWDLRIKDEWFEEAKRPSSLREILELDPGDKCDLSAKACAGILRRAERRGRALPDMLLRALMDVAGATGATGPAWVPEHANAVVASAGHHGHSSPRGDGSDNLVAHYVPEIAMAVTRREQKGPCSDALNGNVITFQRHGDVHATLDANKGSRRQEGIVAFNYTKASDGVGASEDYASTLGARRQDAVMSGSGVRRLTPRECERLQGLPDFHTLIRWGRDKAVPCPACRGKGKILDHWHECTDPVCSCRSDPLLCHGCYGSGTVPHECASDSQRYRVVGNSVATVVLEAIGRRLTQRSWTCPLATSSPSAATSPWTTDPLPLATPDSRPLPATRPCVASTRTT